MGRNTNSSPIKYSASNLGCFYINCINSLSLGNGVIFYTGFSLCSGSALYSAFRFAEASFC